MLRRCVTRMVSPKEAYKSYVASGMIRHDANQEMAMGVIEGIYNDLLSYQSSPLSKKERRTEIVSPRRRGIEPAHVVLKRQWQRLEQAMAPEESVHHPLSLVKGLYLHGGVGCGKTMLMDMFFNELPFPKKLRVHFHQFMLDVHRTMHQIRSNKRTAHADVDIFEECAQRMIANAEVLCFDEMAVSDVADAMILTRLFQAFYRIGCCALFTSNRAPDELYKGGLNRESFLPFIRMLHARCHVLHLPSHIDYRLSGTDAKTFLSPFTDANSAAFNKLFLEMCKGFPPKERVLRVFGRDVVVPRAVAGVCRFSFHELCASELSTADFEVIAKSFHTVFIEDVPQMPARDTDAKRRFLTLIDTLYEYKVKVIVYAEVEPALLEAPHHHEQRALPPGEEHAALPRPEKSLFDMEIGPLINDEEGSFQMKRCISRLQEMRSREYLEAEHKGQEVGLDTE